MRETTTTTSLASLMTTDVRSNYAMQRSALVADVRRQSHRRGWIDERIFVATINTRALPATRRSETRCFAGGGSTCGEPERSSPVLI